MIGDAISHSVLPGIVIAFLISGSLSSVLVIIGASLMGLICTFLIEFFHRTVKIQSDAAIGMVFTFLFAVGVILITAYTGNIDLDVDCVLHGEIAYVPLDLAETGTFLDSFPTQPIILSILSLLILIFVFIGYKPLFLTSFDPEYAIAIGISTSLWHYLLMAAVSVTTVLSFESVGAILVVAFLIVPASTAYLLTDKLKLMILLSCVFGILSSILGYYLAAYLDGSIAGAISVMMGINFAIVFAYTKISSKKLQKIKSDPALNS